MEQYENAPDEKLPAQSGSVGAEFRRVLVLLHPPERGWLLVEAVEPTHYQRSDDAASAAV